MTATVPKSRIFAYTELRGEAEFIIDSRRLKFEIYPMSDEERTQAEGRWGARQAAANRATIDALRQKKPAASPA